MARLRRLERNIHSEKKRTFHMIKKAERYASRATKLKIVAEADFSRNVEAASLSKHYSLDVIVGMTALSIRSSVLRDPAITTAP